MNFGECGGMKEAFFSREMDHQGAEKQLGGGCSRMAIQTASDS